MKNIGVTQWEDVFPQLSETADEQRDYQISDWDIMNRKERRKWCKDNRINFKAFNKKEK